MLSNENALAAQPRPLILKPDFGNAKKEVSDLWLALGNGDLFRKLFHLAAISKALSMALYNSQDGTDNDHLSVVAEFLELEINESTTEIAKLMHLNGIVAPAEKNA